MTKRKTKKFDDGGDISSARISELGDRKLNQQDVDYAKDALSTMLGVFPGMEAVGKGAGFIGKKIGQQVDLLSRPKVQNSVYEFMKGSGVDKKYVQRYVRSPEELENIKSTGYVLPKEGGKSQKYFTAVDEVKTNVPEGTSVLRALKQNVPANRAVRRRDLEVYNKDTGSFEPLKKGGVVKSKASKRADGCCKRGKTKGRMV